MMNQANTQSRVLPHVRLQFNVANPCLDDVWMEGYESAEHAMDELDNPYQRHAKEHDYWNQGWWAGFYGEERIMQYVGDGQTNEVSMDNFALAEAKACNESRWVKPDYKKWAGRALKTAGIIAATVAAIELLDIAV